MIEDTRRVRRVLHSGDPRGDDYRDAEAWIRDIRSRLVHIRGELEDVARIEASFPHDSLCAKVAGATTLSILALYQLLEGDRSFSHRADLADKLWEDARADPDGYIIEDGATWKWRPSNIFKRGGRND